MLDKRAVLVQTRVMGNLEAFGLWVREVGGARKAAKILEISEQYVCNLKSGHRIPGRAVATTIERVCGLLTCGTPRIPVIEWSLANVEEKRARDRAYYAANRDRIYGQRVARIQMNPAKEKARLRAWQKANPEKCLIAARRYKYGLEPEQLEAMKMEQHNCCAICTTTFGEGTAKLHVDHHHSTGKVRALLCAQCNLLLGRIEGNGAWLEKAFAYLEKFGG